jgi:hypothetical protein
VLAPLPSPHFWQNLYLITVSVQGTLLYFISLISDKISHTYYDLLDPQGTLVGFSVLLSPSDYCMNLEFLNYLERNTTQIKFVLAAFFQKTTF